MEHNIYWNIKAALGMSFPNCPVEWPWCKLCEDIEKLKHVQRIIPIIWSLPEQGTFKVNTDGSYMENKGKAGIGGIIRNEVGDFIAAFSIPVHCSSNNMTEAFAARAGIQPCLSRGINNIELQMDSLLIVEMLQNRKN